MALQRSGTFLKAGGLTSAIGKNIKLMNLKPVKRITIKFDPFNSDAKEIRDFNCLLLTKKVAKTNLSCLVRTIVTCDRSEGEVEFNLSSGQNFLFKCSNLTTLELLQLVNKYITPLAPKEDTTSTVETKSDKKGKKKK